jgi:hypothetical protein
MKEPCGEMIELRLERGRSLRGEFKLFEESLQLELDSADALFQLDRLWHFGRGVAYWRGGGKPARRQRADSSLTVTALSLPTMAEAGCPHVILNGGRILASLHAHMEINEEQVPSSRDTPTSDKGVPPPSGPETGSKPDMKNPEREEYGDQPLDPIPDMDPDGMDPNEDEPVN